MKTSSKSYLEMSSLETFRERFTYLQLNGKLYGKTFGEDRILNQDFYRSAEWKRVRDYVIDRDNGCDLGHPDYPISGRIIIHHINPLTINDFDNPDVLLNPDNLVCVSIKTHNALHYGNEYAVERFDMTERKPNDTCPWR